MSLLSDLKRKIEQNEDSLGVLEKKLNERDYLARLENKKKEILLERKEHYSALFKLQNYLDKNPEEKALFNLEPIATYLDDSFKKLVELEAISDTFSPIETMSASDALSHLSSETKQKYIEKVSSETESYFVKELSPFIEKTKTVTELIEKEDLLRRFCERDLEGSVKLTSILYDTYRYFQSVLSNPFIESGGVSELKDAFSEIFEQFTKLSNKYMDFATRKEKEERDFDGKLPENDSKNYGIEIA